MVSWIVVFARCHPRDFKCPPSTLICCSNGFFTIVIIIIIIIESSSILFQRFPAPPSLPRLQRADNHETNHH